MSKKRDNPSAAQRIRVMKRDRFTCVYCGKDGTDVELEIDHIIPVAKGGSNHISNLATACRACNQKKGTNIIIPMKKTSNESLLGMAVHGWKEKEINMQGHIVGNDGDFVLVERFSFWDGSTGDVIRIKKDDLFNGDLYTIYANAEKMRWAAAEWQYRTGKTHWTPEQQMRIDDMYAGKAA